MAAEAKVAGVVEVHVAVDTFVVVLVGVGC